MEMIFADVWGKKDRKTGLWYLLGGNLERIGELASVTSPADYGVSPFLSFFCFARRTTLFYSLQIREIGEKFVAFFPRLENRTENCRCANRGEIFTAGARNVNEGKLD